MFYNIDKFTLAHAFEYSGDLSELLFKEYIVIYRNEVIRNKYPSMIKMITLLLI